MGIIKDKTKNKAIEICKNLNLTIIKLKELKDIIVSKSTAYESSRPSKNKLIKLRNNLIKKFKLTKKELQG